VTAVDPIRIRLRYADLDVFVHKFAPNVTRGGVFLATRNLRPVGSLISFEIQLANGTVALGGQGKVTWVRELNPAEPNRPYGMGVQFTSVDAASRPVLARILKAKELSGPVQRPTGPHAPLGHAAAAGGERNGRTATMPAVDPNVDLVAELGLSEEAIRRVVSRRWMLGARADDDLADLLRPEDPQPVTLAQALSELPRLLDPQSSRRRRGSGGFRMLGQPATGSGPHVITGGEPEPDDADGDRPRAREAAEITNMDAAPDDAAGAESTMGATPTAEAPTEDTNQTGVTADPDDVAEHTPA
jgi:uncharacterized protein (TIGR02266 family)